MKPIRFGVIGLGNIGQFHANYLRDGEVEGAVLTAVSDMDEERMGGYEVARFAKGEELISSGEVDAVVVATPHFFHVPLGVAAFGAGLHVLMEKPIAVHKADADRLIAAHQGTSVVFAAMMQERINPIFHKIKALMDRGDLGELRRVAWTSADWLRNEIYYASGGWRATWKGEGGGLLVNQCPHHLDVLQWLCGMPTRVRGHCRLGKYHDIEVEDEVTAFLEFANGATGVFIASTGEAPGIDRLELFGDRGRILVTNSRNLTKKASVTFERAEMSVSEHVRTSDSPFDEPDTWQIDLPFGDEKKPHQKLTRNFVEAITSGAELIAPGEEGAHSVELANAMLYSSLTDQTIDMPLDAAAYEVKLNELIASSKPKKRVVKAAVADITASF